jgi:hypothetical protein
MDILIGAGLMITGYVLSQRQERKPKKERKVISKNEQFSGKNIYESSRFTEVNEEIKRMANKNYKDSEDYKRTNMIPPFVNSLCNKGDCKGKLPIQMDTEILPKIKKNVSSSKNKNRVTFNEVIPEVDEKITEEEQVSSTEPVSLLTGEKLEMKHNNMVPFFRGAIKQNLRENNTVGIMERFTGKLDTPTIKKEVKSFFDKKPENIYGTPLFTNVIDKDRYYKSGIKNNVSPTPQIRVKPLPEEVVRPVYKSIDQLRTATNPKEVYSGRILSGQNQSTTQRGLEGAVKKNRPERHYKQGADRYLTTGGAIVGDRARDNFENLKATNRVTEENYRAPAKLQIGKTQPRYIRESEALLYDGLNVVSSDPHKEVFKNDPYRNLGASGERVNDYGKCTFIANPNERDTTSTQHILNVSDTKMGNYLYNEDQARVTQKQLSLFQYTGNVESVNPKPRDYTGEYNIQKFKQNVDHIDYQRHLGAVVSKAEDRQTYANTKLSTKEEVLDRGGYQAGPQNQSEVNGKEAYKLTTYKDTIQTDYKWAANTTYNTFNNDLGENTISGNRTLTETDHSDRIDDIFIKSLEKNPFNLKRTFK